MMFQMENCAHPVCITKDLSVVVCSRDSTIIAARYHEAQSQHAAVFRDACSCIVWQLIGLSEGVNVTQGPLRCAELKTWLFGVYSVTWWSGSGGIEAYLSGQLASFSAFPLGGLSGL